MSSTDLSGTATTPAGWYPDPNHPGTVRWWDGTRWTEHTSQAVASAVASPELLAVDPTLPVYNIWIWLTIAIQWVPLIALPVWLPQYLDDVTAAARDPLSSSAAYGGMSPGVVVATVFGFFCSALGIVFAYLDSRALARAGMVRPFHWAWSFLDGYGVYIIGRSVVARRRAGRGLAPMVVWICLEAALILATVVFTFVLVIAVSQTIADVGPPLN
ncbi:MAG: hypothetical protein JWR53_1880 [Glaciihabitans sp.]|nr:hypothetical protein [Glaciihabitans sp.]